MKFWVKNIEQFKKDRGKYNNTLFMKCMPHMVRTMAHFEPRLYELVMTDIRKMRLTDEETIIGTIKYWSQQLLREAITEYWVYSKNQVKWVTNRFYLEQHELINNICNRVLLSTTTTNG